MVSHRIIRHSFFDQCPSKFEIENLMDKSRHSMTAAEIMRKPYFYGMAQKDVAAIVYTYFEEAYLNEKEIINRKKL